jgi:cyclopropane fatty-acyl-phospholipid synthase-like methyltransferase
MRFITLLLSFPFVFLACQESGFVQGEESAEDYIQDSFIYQGLGGRETQWEEDSFDKKVSRLESKERAQWQQPEKLLDWMGCKPTDQILDIGCGTGYFSFRLSQRVSEVYCADIDPRFLEFVDAKKNSLGKSNLHTVLFEKEIPNKNLTVLFDKVLTVNTYHHLENRSLYFSHILEMMKPGAKLYVVDFKSGDLPVGPSQVHKVSSDVVMRELLLSGFDQVMEVDTLLPYQYIVVAGKKKQ